MLPFLSKIWTKTGELCILSLSSFFQRSSFPPTPNEQIFCASHYQSTFDAEQLENRNAVMGSIASVMVIDVWSWHPHWARPAAEQIIKSITFHPITHRSLQSIFSEGCRKAAGMTKLSSSFRFWIHVLHKNSLRLQRAVTLMLVAISSKRSEAFFLFLFGHLLVVFCFVLFCVCFCFLVRAKECFFGVFF